MHLVVRTLQFPGDCEGVSPHGVVSRIQQIQMLQVKMVKGS